MTNREFLTTIIALENVTEDIKAYAEEKLAKLDATNEARKNKPSKKAVENAPIMNQILTEILTVEAQTASTIAEAAGISVQKASALLRQLAAEGKVLVTEVKIPKKGIQKAYSLVHAGDAE